MSVCRHRMLAVIFVGALLILVLSYILPVIVKPLTAVYGIPVLNTSIPIISMVGPFSPQRRNTSKSNIYMPEYSQILSKHDRMPDPCATPRRNTGVEDLLCMKPLNFKEEYKNPCWMDDGVFRCLPYFYLIGNAKCGTTDFFKRINLHPDILPNKGLFNKETSYWSRKRLRLRKINNGTQVPLKTFRWFTDNFQGSKIRNSSTENGYHYKVACLGDPMDFYDRFDEENLPQNTPGAEELLWTTPFVVKHIQPNIKLLLLLRDPINRLYSHYFHGGFGKSSKEFHDHVVQSIKVLEDCFAYHSQRHCLYSKHVIEKLKTPIYASFDVVHLKEWTRAFPLKQFMVFRNEDYSSDIRGTLIRVFKFVNISIPDEPVLERMSSMQHYRETIGKIKAGPMLPETKTLLKMLFQPYVIELARFLSDDRYLFRDTNFG